MAESSKKKDRNVSIVLPTPELKERFIADAKQAGHTPSEHGAMLIANHLDGKSLERFHDQVSDLTDELALFRQSFEQHRRAVFFALTALITNTPGGEMAVKAFEARYLEEMAKGG